jgi:hypothetical protein
MIVVVSYLILPVDDSAYNIIKSAIIMLHRSECALILNTVEERRQKQPEYQCGRSRKAAPLY